VVDKAKVPVVPVGIVGATDDFLNEALRGKRPRIEMRVGSPVHLPAVAGRGEARRTSLQKNADLIMQHIAELLPREYGGYYGNRGTWRSETAQ
jgi:hypothetical protein